MPTQASRTEGIEVGQTLLSANVRRTLLSANIGLSALGAKATERLRLCFRGQVCPRNLNHLIDTARVNRKIFKEVQSFPSLRGETPSNSGSHGIVAKDKKDDN